MTFYELYNKIDALYPKSLSCEWDNDGIMCMIYPDAQVKKVLISLDITEDVVDFALKEGFDTIISHHPLIFKSQKSMSIESYTQRKLIKLIKANINVALGNPPRVTPRFNRGAAIRYVLPEPGTIKSIDGAQIAECMSGVKCVEIMKRAGETAGAVRNSNDRLGFVITQGETVDQAVAIADAAASVIRAEG